MSDCSRMKEISPVVQETINDIDGLYCIIREQLKAAEAILDAAEVLTALERAPAHHDTHPSHNILTGGGRAHGRRCANDTLPNLLQHARYLVQMAHNDCDVMQDKAVVSLQKGGAA